MSNHHYRSWMGPAWLVHILPVRQCVCCRSRPRRTIQREELDPCFGRLLCQITSQPGRVLLIHIECSIGAVLAPGEGCRAAQHREGCNLIFQH